MRYDNRLKFYLDQKTKDHLFEMAAKERLLLETIKNLSVEIKQRGVTGANSDQAGFNVIYGDMHRMVADYSAELDAVLAILDEIQALSQTLDQEKRHDLLEQFGDLKDRLVAVIDSRTMYKKSMGTSTYKAGLMREYNVEVDSLLRMYNRLEKFERTASTRSDTSAVRLARVQKRKLQTILSAVQGETAATPQVSSAYLSEVDEILKLLTELDKLERPAAKRSLDTAIEAEQLRRDLVQHLDKNLLALLGFSDYAGQRATLEEAFQNWRTKQIAGYEVRRTKYAIVKKNLLETGTVKERSRMLNRDLMDALLNYASERYDVADFQLGEIMAGYVSYFSNWEAVQFYRTECLYARGIFAEATSAYEQLLKDYPAGKFRETILLRLLTMAHHLNKTEAFFAYYRQLESLSPVATEQILDRARYLAGYYQLKLGHHGAADSTLRLISGRNDLAGGKYAQAARYLRGIAQANRGNLNSAMALFKEAAGSEALPWSGGRQTSIRNHALLRLGYLHYERAEFAEALKYFDQVSRGAGQHEKSMLGKAWALVKQDSVGRAVAQLRMLTQG